MPALTVRNIPDRVYERLKERAGRNRRSMSNEIVTLLEEQLLPRRVEPDPFIAMAESFHAQFPEPLPDLAAEGKRAGRKYEDPLPGEGAP
ncbi:MAG: Arc family DNA-binding protein [Bacteroidota bacterium]